jgi:ankyrin repeat protein
MIIYLLARLAIAPLVFGIKAVKVVSDGVEGAAEMIASLYYKVATMPPSVFVKICCSGDVSAVEAAINCVDVKNPSYGGAALVELAKIGGNFEVVDALIRNGADVNAKVVYGRTWTPLLNAVRHYNFQMASKLIEEGADVNLRLEKGDTPLLWLAERVSNNIKKNELEMMSLLLRNGADVNAANERGETALIIASKLTAPKLDTLWSALLKRSYETALLSVLIENGADVNAKDAKGNTALMYVSKNAELEGGIPFLLEHGADPSVY